MPIVDNNTTDIIMDLNIPFKVYFILFILVLIIIALKYFFSKEEIMDFIEKNIKNSSEQSNENDKLNLLTKINTKINRDCLENSKYYNELGFFKIYGYQKEKNTKNNLSNENKKSIIIAKNKKVGFSNNIIYENEIEKL